MNIACYREILRCNDASCKSSTWESASGGTQRCEPVLQDALISPVGIYVPAAGNLNVICLK